MGCSASDLDDTKQQINTSNICWSSYNFADVQIGDKKYIFYKTKRHKRVLCLRSYLRRLMIEISDNEQLIHTIMRYITYESEYENEGNKNETLIVENNTVLVLPSNGKRIYEFKSLHIQPFGVLTVTKWIDCDYYNNIGGVLNIHCSENIIIDKHGMINLNGTGLTGLETDTVLTKYCGYQLQNGNCKTLNGIEDEKCIELLEETPKGSIRKPTNLYDFDTFYISKGGSYFKREKWNKRRKIRKIYQGGIGGGCISLKCKDFINNGYVLSNGTDKPVKIGKRAHDRVLLSKLKYFANNGQDKHARFNVKVVDVGIDGTGGYISVHIEGDFVNNGIIQAMKFGEIVIVRTGNQQERTGKLQFGKCNPFPKAEGAELQVIPTGELL